ncbi:hypothetical protein [Nostoc sp. C117]|uniref:hypothetical protein n=1 Tax=Nostoc sp. C117 TaxID=3349875 RepID=UPI00370D3D9E
MQKQILNLAIALPTLANPIEPTIPKVGNFQPVLLQPQFQAPAIKNQFTNPEDGQSPGPTGSGRPVKGPGPRPPRKDLLLQNLGTGLQNTIDSSPVNLNIENPVLGY